MKGYYYLIGGAIGLVLAVLYLEYKEEAGAGSGGEGGGGSKGPIEACDVQSQVMSVNKKYF